MPICPQLIVLASQLTDLDNELVLGIKSVLCEVFTPQSNEGLSLYPSTLVTRRSMW